MSKKVICTGVTGQFASFMVDYLLKNTDYEIYGMVRRLSVNNHKNIEHIKNNPRFHLFSGDLTDGYSLQKSIEDIKPDYYINAAAQSLVSESWTSPVNTFQTDAVSVIYILEAIRRSVPHCRFVNFGSSEQFGDVLYSPQDIKHPFRSRSPYAASKVAAHQIVKVYRESYGIYAIQPICFNYECLTANTPIIVRDKSTGMIDILPIEEIVPHRKNPEKGKKYISTTFCGYDIWDGNKWSQIKIRTATWNDKKNDKHVHRIQCRGGIYEATKDHVSFLQNDTEILTKNLRIGDKIALKDLPELNSQINLTKDEAELIGFLVSEGCIKKGLAQFTNKDINLINRVEYLWMRVTGGYCSKHLSKSGFTEKKDITQLILNGGSSYIKMLEPEIYTQSRDKRIPKRILNSNTELQLIFLKSYNLGDGLKAGHQKTEFKCFGTVSANLAAGLWYLINKTLKLKTTLCPLRRENRIYYYININSNNNLFGQHLVKNKNEVVSIENIEYEGWLFDLETDSGTFSAGVGNAWVHNSPRRGEEFVTRKVTLGVAQIYKSILNNQPILPIELGNINSQRDWSDCEDFIDGIWKMLNQDTPKEYVLSSGETHTIKSLVEMAFSEVGIKGEWMGEKEGEYFWYSSGPKPLPPNECKLVVINPKFYRPTEVSLLCGDSTPIRQELGWSPKTSFPDLVKKMVENDVALLN